MKQTIDNIVVKLLAKKSEHCSCLAKTCFTNFAYPYTPEDALQLRPFFLKKYDEIKF